MPIYIAEFKGLWLPGFAVAQAPSREEAERLIDAALAQREDRHGGSLGPVLKMEEWDVDGHPVIIAWDGNY